MFAAADGDIYYIGYPKNAESADSRAGRKNWDMSACVGHFGGCIVPNGRGLLENAFFVTFINVDANFWKTHKKVMRVF